MWNTILLNIFLSFVIIFAAHHIWEYCKTNYTTKKTKDLVEIRTQKYKSMIENMEQCAVIDSVTIRPPDTATKTLPLPTKFLPLDEKEWLQKELDQFIESL